MTVNDVELPEPSVRSSNTDSLQDMFIKAKFTNAADPDLKPPEPIKQVGSPRLPFKDWRQKRDDAVGRVQKHYN